MPPSSNPGQPQIDKQVVSDLVTAIDAQLPAMMDQLAEDCA